MYAICFSPLLRSDANWVWEKYNAFLATRNRTQFVCRKQHLSHMLVEDNAGWPQDHWPTSPASYPALQKAMAVASQSSEEKISLTVFSKADGGKPGSCRPGHWVLRATWLKGQGKLKSAFALFAFSPATSPRIFLTKHSYSLILSQGKPAHTPNDFCRRASPGKPEGREHKGGTCWR